MFKINFSFVEIIKILLFIIFVVYLYVISHNNIKKITERKRQRNHFVN